MSKRLYGNNYVEKIEFLPDEFEISVTITWCQSVISILNHKEDYYELLNMINWYVHREYQKNELSGLSTNYINMSVGNIKKLIKVCGECCFCCLFPYNYDTLANEYLYNKLGDIKDKIDLLIAENSIDSAIRLVDCLNNSDLKRLALLYIKNIYNAQTDKIIVDFKSSRKKTINKINSILYN